MPLPPLLVCVVVYSDSTGVQHSYESPTRDEAHQDVLDLRDRGLTAGWAPVDPMSRTPAHC